MKKTVRIVVLSLIAVVLCSYPVYKQTAQKTVIPPKEPLVAAVNAVGTEVKEFSINGWARLSEKNINKDRMQTLVKHSMEKFGISNYKINIDEDNYHCMIRAEAVQDYFHAVAICQSLYTNKGKENPEVYMVVNIDSARQQSQQNVKEIISDIFAEINSSPRITTCLIGWFDGKLNEDEWGKKLTTAFAVIDAKSSDKMTNSRFASFTGYTPQISESITVGGKRINVQMVMRYSQYENRTYVIIGSPVITREY